MANLYIINDVLRVPSGSAYIFTNDETAGDYNQTQRLIQSNGTSFDVFSIYTNISIYNSTYTTSIGAHKDNDDHNVVIQ